ARRASSGSARRLIERISPSQRSGSAAGSRGDRFRRSRSISGLLLHELGSQQSPHGPPGLRKVRSGGPFGNLERLRDLPVPPPFQVVKHEHLALNLGKLLQRIEQ